MLSLLAILFIGPLCLSTGLAARTADVATLPLPSISKGAPQQGRIVKAAELPIAGAGYRVGTTWRGRHTNFGTGQLVHALMMAAAHVADVYPASVLGVADMSREEGGTLGHHASHESGRDVDLLYYSTNGAGDPLPPPPDMVSYGPDGLARDADDQGRLRRFDDARNWELVRTLLTDPSVQVEYVFMEQALRDRLLAYAEAAGESQSLRAQAALVLHQPTDSTAHANHMHLRIACPASDEARGCVDMIVPHHGKRRHHRHPHSAARARRPARRRHLG